MTTTVTMPQLGETVSEGTIIRWLVEPSEFVKEGEPLLEVSTDKVDTELPAPAGGILTEVLALAGETVEVGAILAYIGGEAPSPVAAPASASASASAPVAVAELEDSRLLASPVARRLARENQLDLGSLEGTGPEGAVLKRDLAISIASAPEPAGLANALPAFAGVPPGSSTSSTLVAHIDFATAAIDSASIGHRLAAFVIRALVDSLRASASDLPVLKRFVEPSVAYYDAATGKCTPIPNAAAYRLPALDSQLAVGTDQTAEADVALIDSSAQTCHVHGLMGAPIAIALGPRTSVPKVDSTSAGVVITIATQARLAITVDAQLLPLAAITLVANHMQDILETRDWAREI